MSVSCTFPAARVPFAFTSWRTISVSSSAPRSSCHTTRYVPVTRLKATLGRAASRVASPPTVEIWKSSLIGVPSSSRTCPKISFLPVTDPSPAHTTRDVPPGPDAARGSEVAATFVAAAPTVDTGMAGPRSGSCAPAGAAAHRPKARTTASPAVLRVARLPTSRPRSAFRAHIASSFHISDLPSDTNTARRADNEHSVAQSTVKLPPEVRAPFEVYVNGVHQHPGTDYDVLDRALVFERELRKEGKLGFWRWFGGAFGVGTYRQNDSVDVRWEFEGQPRLAEGLDIEPE